MINYFRDQINHIKGAWQTAPGAYPNAAGHSSAIWENAMDSIAEGIFPNISRAFKSPVTWSALLAADIYGGATGKWSSDLTLPLGLIAGGALAATLIGKGLSNIKASGLKGVVANAAGKNGGGLIGKLGKFAMSRTGQVGMAGGGILGALAHGGKVAAGTAFNIGRGLEFGARTVLTGGVHGVQGPLDAWFPNLRNVPVFRGPTGKAIFDPRKIAPNPRIIRRAVGLSALAAVGQGLSEAVSPHVAPAQAYFDGRYMRHVNDMGANGHYAQGILGQNSNMNVDYQTISRVVSQAF